MNEKTPPDAAQETCIKCGSPVNPSDQFCDSCGAKIETSPSCSKCGAHLEPGARFCDTCGETVGKKIVTAQPEHLQAAPPPPPPPIVVQPVPPSIPKVTAKPAINKSMIIVGVFVLGIILAFVFVVLPVISPKNTGITTPNPTIPPSYTTSQPTYTTSQPTYTTPRPTSSTPRPTSQTPSNLPSGFPTNLPTGTYSVTLHMCIPGYGCTNNNVGTIENTDINEFSKTLAASLEQAASQCNSQGASCRVQYSAFNGNSFTATYTINSCYSGSCSTATMDFIIRKV